MTFQRVSFAALAILGLLVAAGCQTTPGGQQTTSLSPQTQAVVVTGGNGGSTAVYIASTDPNMPVLLSSAGADECPDCRAAAINYFKTGVLEAKCPRCGATRTVTTYRYVPSSAGHQ